LTKLPKSLQGLTTTTKLYSAKVLNDAVLKTMRYFEFFQHALRTEELHKFLSIKATKEEVQSALDSLANQGKLHSKDGFWALDESHIAIRRKHLSRNIRMIRAAHFVGKFISLFPFVRGVYLSGSLSKHGATNREDDLDFFIITKAHRVWTTKLLLIAFKKIFLFNREKYFCINLLMAEDQLNLKKKNLYIATEAASLIPLTNTKLLGTFLQQNPFVHRQFPNLEIPRQRNKGLRLNVFEGLIEIIGGAALERRAHKMFEKHVQNQRKESGYYDTSDGVSAYFPESVEESLLNHMSKSHLSDE